VIGKTNETGVMQMKKLNHKITREYRVSSKELIEAFGIKGAIETVGVWSSRSPDQIATGETPDSDMWIIRTNEDIE